MRLLVHIYIHVITDIVIALKTELDLNAKYMCICSGSKRINGYFLRSRIIYELVTVGRVYLKIIPVPGRSSGSYSTSRT